MSPHSIFHPMAALVALTAVVATAAVVMRGVAIQRKQIPEDFHRLFQGPGRPELEAKLTRHYGNLLEWPILFYVARRDDLQMFSHLL
jgi:hypothetical protein